MEDITLSHLDLRPFRLGSLRVTIQRVHQPCPRHLSRPSKWEQLMPAECWLRRVHPLPPTPVVCLAGELDARLQPCWERVTLWAGQMSLALSTELRRNCRPRRLKATRACLCCDEPTAPHQTTHQLETLQFCSGILCGVPGFEASPTREPGNPYLLTVRASCEAVIVPCW